MSNTFYLYNTLSRRKEEFIPVNPPFAGMYVCGPTVYSNPHLGHARVNIVFDILYRHLMESGYKVRYVRNITDVGHLENEETGEGEDRITKKARQEELEPMEIVQKYMNTFHRNMLQLNNLEPDIEPRATGHIIEQQQLIRKLLDRGYAYESGGSVYFDVSKYDKDYKYGILSGRVLDELKSNTRELEGQDQKRNSFDFALWKKASPEHIMRWPSPWSDGFPGWHLECSAMSMKYLGEPFDIHGGGMDLQFPHHECEIAQSTAASGQQPIKYWMHNNMITINGQKMARSLNNFITLDELFAGTHKLLNQSYSPMTIRFFILQAHYRSTLDFSNDALQAAEKGYQRMLKAYEALTTIKPSEQSDTNIGELVQKCDSAINDDLNTPVLISHLFDGARLVNSAANGNEQLSNNDINILKELFDKYLFRVLGLKPEENNRSNDDLTEGVINSLLEIRQKAKINRDWETADKIRNDLTSLGINVKDTKEGFTWERI